MTASAPPRVSIGYMNQVYCAMAYLYADDTVTEVAPTAGVTLTQRHWRDLTSEKARLTPGENWLDLQVDNALNRIQKFSADTTPPYISGLEATPGVLWPPTARCRR